MAINRQHFTDKFAAFPAWACPRCSTGRLSENSGARTLVEPFFSAHDHDEEWWDLEHTVQRFAAVLICTDPACGEHVILSGRAGMVSYGYDEEGEHYGTVFFPHRLTLPFPCSGFRVTGPSQCEII